MSPLPLSPFRRAAAEAVGQALGVDPALFPVSPPKDPAHGDYGVGCFPAAKLLGAAPAQLAQRVVAAFQPTALLASAKAAGPYVNFTVQRAALYGHLFETTLGAPRATIADVGAGRTVCIDFSSPNIAKPLQYHHIRSTVIGHALVRLHRALGYQVVGINHVGDWGTSFGHILAAFQRYGAPDPMTAAAINDLYVRYRAEAADRKKSGDKTLDDAGRAWFKRLEDGDPEARAQWKRVRDLSLAEFQEIYDLLGIRFDEVRGESEYEAAMPAVITMLEQKGLATVSEGALVVNLEDVGLAVPLFLRKSDGATSYATRDLASALYRWEQYHFARSLYVVDKGQAEHFKQLFAVLRKAGFEWIDRLKHVPFGLVRIGGKKTRSREGSGAGLKEVLAEAQEQVVKTIEEINPEMPAEQRRGVARDVGVGAIVFAELATQREKDIDFELERVLSFEGDAGPYVQFAHARCASIMRRGEVKDPGTLRGADPARLARDEEWALAKMLCDLPDEAARAADADEPHVVCRYLLDVCAAFSRWYTLGNQDPALKVLSADADTARARLALTAAARETLRTGLGLLGMTAPDEM